MPRCTRAQPALHDDVMPMMPITRTVRITVHGLVVYCTRKYLVVSYGKTLYVHQYRTVLLKPYLSVCMVAG